MSMLFAALTFVSSPCAVRYLKAARMMKTTAKIQKIVWIMLDADVNKSMTPLTVWGGAAKAKPLGIMTARVKEAARKNYFIGFKLQFSTF